MRDHETTSTSASADGGARAPVAPEPSAATPWPDVVVRLRWPLAFVVILLGLALIALWTYRETLDRAAGAATSVVDLAGSATQVAERLASNVLTGNVTETFIAAIPEIEGTGGGRLELASARTTEIFTRTDERKVLWDWVSLGTTVSEIRVPVTYRYHLRLGEAWRIEVRDGFCFVHAPAIRPTLPPAIHTGGVEKRVDADWLRFDAEDQLTELERSITGRLEAYAADDKHLNLVREESRRTVAEFVRAWLLREDQWGEGRVRAVKVIFPDEATVDPERIGASVVFRD